MLKQEENLKMHKLLKAKIQLLLSDCFLGTFRLNAVPITQIKDAS